MTLPRRVLITGASGFVGHHLTPVLRAALPAAELVTAPFEVTDAAAVRAAVIAARPEGCVHLAGIAAIPAAREKPDLAWQVNLHGTLNLARALMAHAPDCRLVHVSSADTYGKSFAAGVALDETAPLAPMNTYGATKAAADLALGAMAADGLNVVRVRPFNHTGPGQSEAFVVAAFARQLALIAAGRQAPVMKVGALAPKRDFLDVRDVCAAYARCLTAPDLPPGSVFNIASGTPRAIGEVLAQLAEIAGVAVEIEVEQARLRAGDIPLACGDAGRARAALGWAPAVAWERTLREVIEDWRARVA